MTIEEERVKVGLAGLLVLLMAAVSVDLWSLDLAAAQGTFGALLSSELMAFAILCYVYSKPSVRDLRVSWVLAGLASLVAFLLIALWAGA